MSTKSMVVRLVDSPQVKHGSLRAKCSMVVVVLFILALALAAAWEQSLGLCWVPVQETLPDPQTGEQSYYIGAFSVVDLSVAELMADFPELQGLDPASDQEQLPTLLNKVGQNVADASRRLASVAADERITEEQYDYDGSLKSALHQQFNYLIQVQNGAVEEYRADARMRRVDLQGGEGFLLSRNFASQWVLLHTEIQWGSRFRYLGSQEIDGRSIYILAFAEQPGQALVTGSFNHRGKSKLLLYQGLAWVDALSSRVVRLRLDLLAPRLDVALEKETTEIKLGEVHIPQAAASLWLPLDVTVTVICNGQLFKNQHHYSNYRLFDVQSTIRY